jgi:excisionase family DNA binding protein
MLIETLMNETLRSVFMGIMLPLLALLNETDAARALNVTKACLRRWRRERRGLPFVKVGRLVRYRPEDIERFVMAHTKQVPEELREAS